MRGSKTRQRSLCSPELEDETLAAHLWSRSAALRSVGISAKGISYESGCASLGPDPYLKRNSSVSIMQLGD